MNRILTTWGSSGQPFTSPTSLDHLQDAFYEGFKSIVRGLIGPTYDATKAYAIWGCYYSAGPVLTEGAIYFEDEIWYVPYWAPGFACGGGSVPILNKTTTWASTDPLDYKDGSSHNTHRIRRITATCGTSGSGDVCDIADLCRIEMPQRMLESAGTATAASPITIDFRQNNNFLYNGLGATGASFDIDATGALNGATAEVIIVGSIDDTAPLFFISSITSTSMIILTPIAINAGAGAVVVRFKFVKPSNTASEYVTIEVISS